jgi:hypothetical protein
MKNNIKKWKEQINKAAVNLTGVPGLNTKAISSVLYRYKSQFDVCDCVCMCSERPKGINNDDRWQNVLFYKCCYN